VVPGKTMNVGMHGTMQSIVGTTGHEVAGRDLEFINPSTTSRVRTSDMPDFPNREATASIRGYHYQFDATINAILALKESDILTIEGIEDFDITRGDLSELFQCKYYAAQRLTSATIRDAILPMLKGFVSIDRPINRIRQYHLYGYFEESQPGERVLTVADLKELLVRREQIATPSGGRKTRSIDVQREIGATDADLTLFAQRLTIHTGSAFEEHQASVKQVLKIAFGVSADEAEGYIYPTAFTLVSGLAANPDRSQRTISRATFILRVRPSHAIYNAWSLRVRGVAAYCGSIRRQHFSMQNVDNVHRFFVIEASQDVTDATFLVLLRTLQRKWSSHRIRRKPDAERYAPFVFLRRMVPERLAALKHLLQAEGAYFVDGYAFHGAQFNLEQLRTAQTYANRLSLRFLNSDADFLRSIEGNHGGCVIYDFFLDSRTEGFSNSHHVVAIPITSIELIPQIV
jgi:hypothetical protein